MRNYLVNFNSWINKKIGRDNKQSCTPLIFRDNLSAFKYACCFMDNTLKIDAILPALVIDPKIYTNTQETVLRDERGIQVVPIKVAADDGGFLVLARALNKEVEDLHPGDFVTALMGGYIEGLGDTLGDERSGWAALIVPKLKPELDIGKGWRFEKKFT